MTHAAFGPVRNSELFSNHWLEHRLPLEPEWREQAGPARAALERLGKLWQAQRGRVERYGDEQGLEHAFVQPVLAALGWELKYQTHLREGKPDYALFLDEADLDAALAAGRTEDAFWHTAAVVADGKAWHVALDRRHRSGAKREYPPEQIERYLLRSGLDFGMLTNGRLWRLFPRELETGQRRYETYLEADLPRILDATLRSSELTGQDAAFDDFLRFWLFFSPAGFRAVDGRRPLVRRARSGSGEYRLGVGEGLKDRVFEALRLCIDGFLHHRPNGLSAADLDRCRDAAFVLLYRLLFVLYAEDRGLLPYRRNATYTDNRSLGRLRDDATGEAKVDFGRLDPTATDYWTDLGQLFDLIDRGHGRYGVPAYNGGLFNAERHPFLEAHALTDPVVARVIDQLSRAPDPNRPDAGLFRVDYRDLAIQHLGSVYEGLLEMRPKVADVPIRVVRRKSRRRGGRCQPPEERTVTATAAVPKGFETTDVAYGAGAVYLETDKGERRATGSYYTPQHIVDHIVDRTLGPLLQEVEDDLRRELAEVDERHAAARGAERDELARCAAKLRGDYDDRVLTLRILDPAMGSGHFLITACRYVAECIATCELAADPDTDGLVGDEPTLAFWKRRVVERCLYGVDATPWPSSWPSSPCGWRPSPKAGR